MQGDLIAIGSMCYEGMTGYAPYDDLAEREINSRYMNCMFPETGSLCKELRASSRNVGEVDTRNVGGSLAI